MPTGCIAIEHGHTVSAYPITLIMAVDEQSAESPPLDVLVVGSGFSGLCMAIKLQQAGLSYLVLEQADRLGGTWRDNSYPGAACDVPSNLYCFSFAPNPHWSRSYPRQDELEGYLGDCADRYGIRPQLRFQHRVSRARFDQGRLLWQVEVVVAGIARNVAARSLILATGGLSRPQMPDIAGLSAFSGEIFHTARWRHDVSLAGKRIGVIGTGASAIQVVPELAAIAERLTVFQRTPPWVIFKPDFPVSPSRRDARRRQPWRQLINRAFTYAWHECWAVGFTRMPWLLKGVQQLVRVYLALKVPDRELRSKLQPDYVIGCKRVLLSNDYYPALARENVQLVTAPIARITASGITTSDGIEHPLDVIVACTGFHAAEAGAPFPLSGLDGRELDAVWREGPQAYLGTTVSGFPNMFIMTGPNTALGHNSMVYMIEAQARYVMDALAHLPRRPGQALEVTPAAQRRYNEWLQARLAKTVWNTGGCRSWYRASSGLNTTLWPDFTFVFRYRLRRFDADSYRFVVADGVNSEPGDREPR